METSTIAPKSIDAVIISSYKYDDPYTDAYCAWYTVYTIFEIESKKIYTVKCCTGCNVKLDDEAPELNIIPITDEIKESYLAALEESRQAEAKAEYERYSEEVKAYNEKLLPNDVGQIVEIMDGRDKGVIGKVTWFGKNKYKNMNNYKYGYESVSAAALGMWASCKAYKIPHENDDLICIRPLGYHKTFDNGKEKIYIDPSKCKVLEGYKPVELTVEDCYKFQRWHNDNFSEKWHMGYDSVSNI